MLFSTILLSTAGKELGLEEELGYFSRHPSQITFFCGHDPECLVFGSVRAAQQAKQNVGCSRQKSAVEKQASSSKEFNFFAEQRRKKYGSDED